MPKILVIEDDEIMNSMLVQMLSESGHEVTGAADGIHGVALFQAGGFDLIVTDIVMPDKEGLETIREIRRSDQKIPIIAISGGGRLSPEGYLQMASTFGADYTFQKPLQQDAFLGAVRECLLDISHGSMEREA